MRATEPRPRTVHPSSRIVAGLKAHERAREHTPVVRPPGVDVAGVDESPEQPTEVPVEEVR